MWKGHLEDQQYIKTDCLQFFFFVILRVLCQKLYLYVIFYIKEKISMGNGLPLQVNSRLAAQLMLHLFGIRSFIALFNKDATGLLCSIR
jgi:hypothetical protein